MSTLAAFLQHRSSNGQFSRFQESSQNHGTAMKACNQAIKRRTWQRLRVQPTGRSVQLLHYPTTERQTAKQAAGSVVVMALNQINGSKGRKQDFTNQFWPVTEHTCDRWGNIAMAMGIGQLFPPFKLIESAGRYVMRDGHHHISVARAIGQAVIEMQVI